MARKTGEARPSTLDDARSSYDFSPVPTKSKTSPSGSNSKRVTAFSLSAFDILLLWAEILLQMVTKRKMEERTSERYGKPK